MGNNNILVSISCTAYNQEKYIAQAIEGFIKQKTNFKYEVLIHDDASTDKTAEIIKAYEKKYPEIIKPIYQVENQYSKGKRVAQINLNRAKGKYIAICEGDDYWTDEYKLQKQINYMEKYPECGLCFHTVDIYDEKKKEIIGKMQPYNENCISPVKDVIMGGGSFMGTNSIIYRNENMKNPPNFYLECPVGDYPLQILHSTKKYAYFIKDSMSVYRVNTGVSWTDKNQDYKKQIEISKKIIKMLEDFNEYSNKKYERIIIERIKRISYKIIKYDLKEKILTREEFRKHYNILPLKRKFQIILKKIFNK